jgi:ribosomal protein L11 methyltransferase
VIRLAVRVRRDDAEPALAELLALAPAGVEEADRGDEVEYAIYGAPGELPELGELQAAVGGALVAVSARAVPDDWSERWKAFHRPLVLGDRLVVRPPWEPAAATPAGAVDVVIDPGQAFGTGAHASTRLGLELLLELAPGGALLDLGCGSGVLAIAAEKLGWRPVTAADHDPLAVAATAANARANGSAVSVRRVDLRVDRLPPGRTVLANLLGPLLVAYAERLGEDHQPERVVASGLLVTEAAEVARAFAARGLVEVGRRERDGWAALLLTAGAA